MKVLIKYIFDIGLQLQSCNYSESNKENVIAMLLPSITDIRGLSTEQLIQHLQAKFPDDLDNGDLGILQMQKIKGCAFLALTEEKLERYGMKGGPVSGIAGYVTELKGMCHPSIIH
jgi:hypothetical protein